ncbi:unnamed protein product [Phyllotreta striolata]|uniref:RRM domain-containing protein n=1 Tax=Phyllotreta striolata TaxID=444603 RepID=A0A9N9TP84_PHYSR|nr:unnamed protein product [Phyllotreta striolata]
MSVIIRLQNLPWSANALDIRQYFHGLSIPEGGVHIVGGELGDAFIAFSTDEDARQAFTRSNGKIKEVQITLTLSSRTEMQRVIEQARSQSFSAFMQTPAVAAAAPAPAAPPALDATKPDRKRDAGRRRSSRSKSRERRDRSRDRRDRRHRRSRSRSRDRNDRKSRRGRDRSRGRSKSKERKSRDRKRGGGGDANDLAAKKIVPEVWSKPQEAAPAPAALPLLAFNANRSLEGLDNLSAQFALANTNQFPSLFNNRAPPMRDWPPLAAAPFLHDNYHHVDNNPAPLFNNRFPKNYLNNNNNNNNRHHHHHHNQHQDGEDCCVSLEPFYGGYGDVRRFFQGLFIGSTGIKFINDRAGRSTGVVFVRFASRKFKEEAMNMYGRPLNGVAAVVTHIADEEFDEAVDRYNPRIDDDRPIDDGATNATFRSRNITKYFNNKPGRNGDGTGEDAKAFSCLTVDDLPTYCKEQDILHMFSQHPLVALILTTKKRGGHVAYVKFSGADVARQALEEDAHHVVGGKPVTVRPCGDEEFDEINRKHEVNLGDDQQQQQLQQARDRDCCRVTGLPDKTTDKDVADFFSDIGVVPVKVYLIDDNAGFSGRAYCEFAGAEEAAKAERKNGTAIDDTTVAVELIAREEMLEALKKPDEQQQQQQHQHQQQHDQEQKHPPRQPLFNFRPSFGHRGGGGGGPRFGPRFNNRFGFQPPAGRDVFEDAPPGCTLYLKNVPYKATTGDILEFFEGYRHTNNVSRRYNPNNTPSDEAKIVFAEPEEAARAARELQKARIWDRQIFLRQE